MTISTRIILLGLALSLVTLLSGCPGMPTGPGGATAEQNMPPGLLPPAGLESGGARTLMGTSITPTDDSILLFRYTGADEPSPEAEQWQSCRRIIATDGGLFVEGINYDGRVEGAEMDVNQLLPEGELTSLYWKYEPTPPSPEEAPEEAEEEAESE